MRYPPSPLEHARRQLDGGSDSGPSILSSIEDELSSLASRASSLVSGASAADVASGKVDPSTLSRADKVALAVDGAVPGAFESNPWGSAPAKDFDPSVSAFAHLNGGVVLVISCDASTLDTLESKAIAPRFAFMWDDTIVGETGVLSLDFTGKTFLVAVVSDQPLGERLSLWCTDSSVTFSLLQQAPPSQADQVRKQVFGAVGASSNNPLEQILNAVQGALDISTAGLVAFVVVSGVCFYLLLKSEAGQDVVRAGLAGGA